LESKVAWNRSPLKRRAAEPQPKDDRIREANTGGEAVTKNFVRKTRT
jgi:hypothetical protein